MAGRGRTRIVATSALAGVVLVAFVAADVAAQTPRTARLGVRVIDQTDAVIVGATVTVATDSDAATRESRSSDSGEVEFDVALGAQCSVEAEAPGFARAAMRVSVLRAVTRVVIRLQVAGVTEHVIVTRGAREDKADPRGSAFKRVLRGEDLAALPDDPEALREALQQMAWPGAVFRVDGFSGSRLPPKEHIEEVRLSFSDFSAEHHSYSGSRIDVLTKPGAEGLHFSGSARMRHPSLNARDPFGRTPAKDGQYHLEAVVAAPLWRDRASFLSAVTTTRQNALQSIVALVPSGPLADSAERKSVNTTLWLSAAQSLGSAGSLRGRWYESHSGEQNGGVGGQTLPERAVDSSGTQRTIQVSIRGPIGNSLYHEARVELLSSRSEVTPKLDSAGVIVGGAFFGGGAQVGGGRRERVWTLRDDVDLVWGRQAFRVGFETESLLVKSDRWENREGTYIFASLDDYLSSRPVLFTRRTGDPYIALRQWRGAGYVQDDVRLATGLTASAGLRVEGQSRVSGWRLAPRVSVSWSPFTSGQTAFRFGVGRYYEWLSATMEEQVARVDGYRQRELVVASPAYPDDGGSGVCAGSLDRYELAPDIRFPKHRRVLVAVEHTMARAWWPQCRHTADQPQVDRGDLRQVASSWQKLANGGTVTLPVT